jgi:hypothetical protein
MEEEFTVEDFVRTLVERCELSHVRSSSTLRDLFNEIILAITARGYVHSWGLYCMKSRIESLQQLTVDQLCIPQYMTALGVGVDSIASISWVASFTGTKPSCDVSFIDRVRQHLVDIFLLFVRSENELRYEGKPFYICSYATTPNFLLNRF